MIQAFYKSGFFSEIKNLFSFYPLVYFDGLSPHTAAKIL